MNNRNKSSYWIMVIMAFIFSFTAISFAFASISGSDSKWDVHFDNLSSVYIEEMAKEIERPVIIDNSTNINSFRIEFYGTGKASYVFDVINDGTFDAYISSITLLKPICYSEGNTYDSYLVCKDFDYVLSYDDGSLVKLGDVLPKNSKKTLRFTMLYTNNSPTNSLVTISDISASVIYSEKYF